MREPPNPVVWRVERLTPVGMVIVHGLFIQMHRFDAALDVRYKNGDNFLHVQPNAKCGFIEVALSTVATLHDWMKCVTTKTDERKER